MGTSKSPRRCVNCGHDRDHHTPRCQRCQAGRRCSFFRNPAAPWRHGIVARFTVPKPEPRKRKAGAAVVCWRRPYSNIEAATRITLCADTWEAETFPCPCGPRCEHRHAVVFADHGQLRVRRIHEPPKPDLADELRLLYPPPPSTPRKGRPKSTQRHYPGGGGVGW